MNEVMLIKRLDKNLIKEGALLPISFDLGDVVDKKSIMDLFLRLRDENLVQSDRMSINSGLVTVDVLSGDITKITKKLIDNSYEIYGVYMLYDNFLGGNFNGQ